VACVHAANGLSLLRQKKIRYVFTMTMFVADLGRIEDRAGQEGRIKRMQKVLCKISSLVAPLYLELHLSNRSAERKEQQIAS
jgi:hypothetical protein